MGGDTKKLIRAILKQSGGVQKEASQRTPEAAPKDTEVDTEEYGAMVEAMLEVYFELEEASERDALVEELGAIELPVVTRFFECMLEEDEDDYIRGAAAIILARRGSQKGIAALDADFTDPAELFFFENAVRGLSEIRGEAFYHTLKALLVDDRIDSDQRREVVLGMEALNVKRALADFMAFVDSISDIDTMPDDLVEVMMMVFVRHEHDAALGPLRALRKRIEAAPMDPEEREELYEFVTEGMRLLNPDL